MNKQMNKRISLCQTISRWVATEQKEAEKPQKTLTFRYSKIFSMTGWSLTFSRFATSERQKLIFRLQLEKKNNIFCGKLKYKQQQFLKASAPLQ